MEQTDSSRINNNASEESASSRATNHSSKESASHRITNHSSEESASSLATNHSSEESASSLATNHSSAASAFSPPSIQPATPLVPGDLPEQSPPLLILFDGVCNLCNGSVQFILKRDKSERFFFASLQSPLGQAYLQKLGLPATDFNSFVLIEKDQVYTRSTAALRVVRHLGGIWKIGYALRILPVRLRDGIYNWIARHRYQWFGRRQSCWLPTPELKKRFLE